MALPRLLPLVIRTAMALLKLLPLAINPTTALPKLLLLAPKATMVPCRLLLFPITAMQVGLLGHLLVAANRTMETLELREHHRMKVYQIMATTLLEVARALAASLPLGYLTPFLKCCLLLIWPLPLLTRLLQTMDLRRLMPSQQVAAMDPHRPMLSQPVAAMDRHRPMPSQPVAAMDLLRPMPNQPVVAMDPHRPMLSQPVAAMDPHSNLIVRPTKTPMDLHRLHQLAQETPMEPLRDRWSRPEVLFLPDQPRIPTDHHKGQ